jgi:hypothetical protein
VSDGWRSAVSRLLAATGRPESALALRGPRRLSPGPAYAHRSAIQSRHGPQAYGFGRIDRNEDGLRSRLALTDAVRHSIDAQHCLRHGDATGRLLVDDLNTLLDSGEKVVVRDNVAFGFRRTGPGAAGRAVGTRPGAGKVPDGATSLVGRAGGPRPPSSLWLQHRLDRSLGEVRSTLEADLAAVVDRDLQLADSWRVSVDEQGRRRRTHDRETLHVQAARPSWQRVEDLFFLFPGEALPRSPMTGRALARRAHAPGMIDKAGTVARGRRRQCITIDAAR